MHISNAIAIINPKIIPCCLGTSIVQLWFQMHIKMHSYGNACIHVYKTCLVMRFFFFFLLASRIRSPSEYRDYANLADGAHNALHNKKKPVHPACRVVGKVIYHSVVTC